MSEKATNASQVPVEQIFAVPAGSEKVFTPTDGLVGIAINDPVSGVGGSFGLFSGSNDVLIPLQSPNLFSVVDQQLRRTAEGITFVDIVIEVEDVVNANEYEAAISRQIS